MADNDTVFTQRWHRHDTLTLSTDQSKEKLCSYALQFEEWLRQICKDDLSHIDIVSLNQIKVRVADRYMELRNFVPKSHRNHVGEQGHFCIFHVYEQMYQKIRSVELMLIPPMLFVPSPAPPPPPPPQIAGITFGELVDEEDE